MSLVSNQKENFQSVPLFSSEKGNLPFMPYQAQKKALGPRVLQQRKSLKDVMDRLEDGKDLHIVCVPSLTFNQEDIKSVIGFKHYETRSLWQILMAQHPQIEITFVTSVNISPEIINYYLELLPNSDDAKRRVNIIQLNEVDESLSLVENLLKDEKTLGSLKQSLDETNSFLLSFLTSSYENKLASELGIPTWGCLEELEYYQTKSGNREVFEEANINYAYGFNDLKSEDEIIEAILKIKLHYPSTKKLVVKLDKGVSGDGNAIFTFHANYLKLDHSKKKASIVEGLKNMKFQAKGMDWNSFLEKASEGTIVEVFLEGENKTSSSVQGRIFPDGRVEIISTHEQVLDENGMKYLGCTFPAKSEFRTFISHQAYKIGKVMQRKGVLGYFAVDFLVMERSGKKHCYAIEVNVRQGGTTHPYQTAKFLTGAQYLTSTGQLIDNEGNAVYYLSNDNLILDKQSEILTSEFLSFMSANGISFDKKKKRGVVFHLLSALEGHGKVGYTVIGSNPFITQSLSKEIMRLSKEFEQLQ